MEIGKQKVYWNVLGTHTSRKSRIGQREELNCNTITIESPEAERALQSYFYPIFILDHVPSLHEGWSRASTLPAAGGKRAPVVDRGPMTSATETLIKYQ